MKQLPPPSDTLFPLAAPSTALATQERRRSVIIDVIDVTFTEVKPKPPPPPVQSPAELAAGRRLAKVRQILKYVRSSYPEFCLDHYADPARAYAECLTAIKQLQMAAPLLKSLIGFEIPKRDEKSS